MKPKESRHAAKAFDAFFSAEPTPPVVRWSLRIYLRTATSRQTRDNVDHLVWWFTGGLHQRRGMPNIIDSKYLWGFRVKGASLFEQRNNTSGFCSYAWVRPFATEGFTATDIWLRARPTEAQLARISKRLRSPETKDLPISCAEIIRTHLQPDYDNAIVALAV